MRGIFGVRIRRKPWARPELEACPFYVPDPCANRGRWAGCFSVRRPIVLELGCGKGRFAGPTAAARADINLIAVDIKSEMLVLAKRCIEGCVLAAGRGSVDNALVTSFDIARISDVFSADDVVERIYINFPNPWPKSPHKKRRLTHPRQLAQYSAFLAKGGEIHFKTDDGALYRDSLRYFDEAGFDIVRRTDDLYEDGVPEGAVLTEHEERFVGEGKPIKYLVAVARGQSAKSV